jgi:hypothetical protein
MLTPLLKFFSRLYLKSDLFLVTSEFTPPFFDFYKCGSRRRAFSIAYSCESFR